MRGLKSYVYQEHLLIWNIRTTSASSQLPQSFDWFFNTGFHGNWHNSASNKLSVKHPNILLL